MLARNGALIISQTRLVMEVRWGGRLGLPPEVAGATEQEHQGTWDYGAANEMLQAFNQVALQLRRKPS